MNDIHNFHMKTTEVIALNIRRARERASLSQADLGAAIGLTQAQISKIEKGQSEPTLKNLSLIAERLGIPLPSLLDESFLPSEEIDPDDKNKEADPGSVIFEHHNKGTSTKLVFSKDTPESLMRAAISEVMKSTPGFTIHHADSYRPQESAVSGDTSESTTGDEGHHANSA